MPSMLVMALENSTLCSLPSLSLISTLIFAGYIIIIHSQNFNFFKGLLKNFYLSSSTSTYSIFWPASSGSSSSNGASSSCYLYLSYLFSFCFLFFLSTILFSLSFSPRKYSPVSIRISYFLGNWAGGNGSYSFFSSLLLFFFFCLICLNFGKNLSQFSSFILSSFINSLLIISYLMWYIGCTFCIVSATILLNTLMFFQLPMMLTVLPWTKM